LISSQPPEITISPFWHSTSHFWLSGQYFDLLVYSSFIGDSGFTEFNYFGVTGLFIMNIIPITNNVAPIMMRVFILFWELCIFILVLIYKYKFLFILMYICAQAIGEVEIL